MNREEILEKMEELETMLEEQDEEMELLEEQKKQAKVVAKTVKILMDEFENEGLDKELAIELLKLGVANQR